MLQGIRGVVGEMIKKDPHPNSDVATKMSTISHECREKQLETSMDRVYELVEKPMDPSEVIQECTKLQIMRFDECQVELIQKAILILKTIEPCWATNEEYSDIVDFIKDELTRHMTRQYNMSTWKTITVQDNHTKVQKINVDRIWESIKVLKEIDGHWQTTMPAMVKKIKFDVKRGLGMPLC